MLIMDGVDKIFSTQQREGVRSRFTGRVTTPPAISCGRLPPIQQFAMKAIPSVFFASLAVFVVTASSAAKPDDMAKLINDRACAGCDLAGANLYSYDLQGADLSSANLAEAAFQGSNLGFATLTNANLEQANLALVKLNGADLKGAKLGKANLYGADLAGADLAGADLSNANLEGANLRGAILEGANLQKANLLRARMAGATLTDAKFDGARMPDGQEFKLGGNASTLQQPVQRPLPR